MAKRVFWDLYHNIIDIYFLRTEFDLNGLSLQDEEVIGAKTVSAAEMVSLAADMDYIPREYRQAVSDEIRRLIVAGE